MSIYSEVPLGPSIELFALNQAYLDDTYPKKVNLGIGAYRTEEGKPWVLPVVRQTEQKMAADESLDHEYQPILGLASFSDAATKLLLGHDSPVIKSNQVVNLQTISGTGALRVGADFCCNVLNYTHFYYSTPTWDNHHLIFVKAGFTQPRQYRYWDAKERGLDIAGFLEDLNNAPEKSVIILHPCAHNPTGCDPTQEQWEQIADVMEKNKLVPFFDSAYQGFVSGDVDKDAWAVRYFVKRGFELLCAQSFSKTFGLYNERVGNLVIVSKSRDNIAQIKSQLTLIARGMYSNPANHGACVVSTILNSAELTNTWYECIKTMSRRTKEMREQLHNALKELKTPGSWNHIVTQIGMFSFTGLTVDQVNHMKQNYHIYLLANGRINICGLNTKNVKYVAQAIHESVLKFPA